MKDFFISYTSADRTWAEWIAWELEGAGYTTVLQAWDFRTGGNFVLEMDQAARGAERTVAVLSPDYLRSAFAAPEWAAAFARDPTGVKRLLVPVRVRACDLSGLLAQTVYVDVVGADEAVARQRLLDAVRGGRAKPQVAPGFPGAGGAAKEQHRPPAPFPGEQASADPALLFLCAAAADQEHLPALRAHLRQAERSGLVRLWHPSEVPPGQDRDVQMEAHFEGAQVILLLVSAHLLGSDEQDGLIARAMARHWGARPASSRSSCAASTGSTAPSAG